MPYTRYIPPHHGYSKKPKKQKTASYHIHFKLRKKNAQSPILTEWPLWASDIVEWSPQYCASSLGANHCNCCRPKPLSPTVESSLNIIQHHRCSVIITLHFIFIILFNFISFIIRTQSSQSFINKATIIINHEPPFINQWSSSYSCPPPIVHCPSSIIIFTTIIHH